MNLEYIKKLREETGESLIACKQALEDAGDDFFHALEILKEKLTSRPDKKKERVCAQGLIGTYIHSNGQVGSLVEVRCETDFVSNTDEFKQLIHDLAMQIVALNPIYLAPQDIPEKILECQRAIYLEELQDSKKPAEMMEKIIAGKLDKYYSEVCLLNQWCIKDDKAKVQDLIATLAKKVGERVEVIKFVRFSI